jgi:hypothetical protein
MGCKIELAEVLIAGPYRIKMDFSTLANPTINGMPWKLFITIASFSIRRTTSYKNSERALRTRNRTTKALNLIC